MTQNESVPSVPRCEVCGEEMHMFCISEGAHTRREWRCFSVHEAHQMNPKCKVCGRKMELKPRSLFNWNLDDNWICPATPDQHRNAELEREAKKKDVRIEELGIYAKVYFKAGRELMAERDAFKVHNNDLKRELLSKNFWLHYAKSRNEELEKAVLALRIELEEMLNIQNASEADAVQTRLNAREALTSTAHLVKEKP